MHGTAHSALAPGTGQNTMGLLFTFVGRADDLACRHASEVLHMACLACGPVWHGKFITHTLAEHDILWHGLEILNHTTGNPAIGSMGYGTA